jgi:hypothetical protein
MSTTMIWVLFGIGAAIWMFGPIVLKALKGPPPIPAALPPPDWLSKVNQTELQQIRTEFEATIASWPPEKNGAAKATLEALLANDLQRAGRMTQIISLEEFNFVKATFDRVFLLAMKDGVLKI